MVNNFTVTDAPLMSGKINIRPIRLGPASKSLNKRNRAMRVTYRELLDAIDEWIKLRVPEDTGHLMKSFFNGLVFTPATKGMTIPQIAGRVGFSAYYASEVDKMAVATLTKGTSIIPFWRPFLEFLKQKVIERMKINFALEGYVVK